MPNAAKQQKISVGESRRSTTRPVAVPDPACSTSTRFRRSPAGIQEGVDDSGVWKPSAPPPRTRSMRKWSRCSRPTRTYPGSQGVQGTALRAAVVPCRQLDAEIALSVIAFFVVMWLPTHPLWLILTVSVVFVVGVLSLFFTAGNYCNNPNLDANGTAV